MIEFKNVNKSYKVKNGPSVIALDNLNLKIENRGLVFIVGKSGSGKSTILNLLGGLDNPTSGELFVNGKNINNFKNKQYDAYRNTYIGFIFQEFNVLEQYNVYENIELALKLQNQKTDRKYIDALLDKLGLHNLGKRKINELSGGQKQRVAIARAIIKKPKMILADEPTGNLDKNSSEQIFNILKDISKEQLVIVVSHDIEAASKYANRIIEIEDGKVINDTKDDITDENLSFELKKSKLPLPYALKMAINSFKSKPIKLLMTIILTTLSLIFMGFTVNCALFDRTMLITNTMRDNNDYIYDIQYSQFGPMGSINTIELNNNDFNYIKELTGSKLNVIHNLYDNGEILHFEFGENNKNSKYYDKDMSYFQFVEVEDTRLLDKLIGTVPKQENEIVVHKYFADYAIKFGIMTYDNNLYFPQNYEDLVKSRKEIKLGANKVIITGIIDDDNSLYAEAKKSGTFESDKLHSYFSSNYVDKASLIYVNGFTKNAILRIDKLSLLNRARIGIRQINGEQNFISNNINALNESITVITKDGMKKINTLSKNEVIISIDSLKEIDKNFNLQFTEFLEMHRHDTYENSLKNFTTLYLKNNYHKIRLYLLIYFSDYENVELNIAGINLDDNNYISYQYIEEYKPLQNNIYSVKIYDDDKDNLTHVFNKLIFKNFAYDNDIEYGNYYNYSVSNSADLSNIMSTYKFLGIYILIISLIFILFTFLLFSNFISVSVSYCKKEIGILRALGATNRDIIKIFGYESIIIAVISWVLSIVGWLIACELLDQSMFGNMYYTLNGIVPHPLVPIIIFIYTIVIAIFITIVSISKITKIKPIEAILNK